MNNFFIRIEKAYEQFVTFSEVEDQLYGDGSISNVLRPTSANGQALNPVLIKRRSSGHQLDAIELFDSDDETNSDSGPIISNTPASQTEPELLLGPKLLLDR